MKRLDRPFFVWITYHFFEYIHYYIGAIGSLYLLHHFQSEVPALSKKLADLMSSNQLDQFNLFDFFKLAFYILIFRTLSRLLFFYPARIQQKHIRVEFLDMLESAFPKSYASYSEGEVFHHLNNDINRLRALVGFAFLQVANIVIASYVFIPKIKEFNSDFLIAFTPILLCVVIFMISMYFLYPLNKKIMEKHANVQNFLIESFEAKHTIKNYSKERSIGQKFRLVNEQELKAFFKYDFGITIPYNIIKVGFALSLLYAATIVFENNQASSDLILFAGFLFLIIEPLMSLSWIGIVFSQGYGSWSRIKSLLNKLDHKYDSYTYDVFKEKKYDFWDEKIELNFKRAKWNIVVGDTGCGKSTVLEDLAISLSKQKKSFSFIQQEPFMYNDTIEANIFLGQQRTKEKLALCGKLLKAFGLNVLAPSIEEVLSLEIGENGKKVSGGQAKRIALMRSLVSEVETIIWDDPFSSVDLILENEILEYLKNEPILKNKTFVLSSHRLSTLRNSDYVFFICKEEGIKEQGEVKELLNTNSEVYEYFKQQLV